VELATLLTRLADTPFRSIRSILQSLGNPLDGLRETLLGPTATSSVFRPEEQVSPEPYISQLLLLPVPMGAMKAEQRYTLRTGAYGTTPETRAAMLRGSPTETQRYGPAVYINTPRALASAMHQDPPYLMGLHALLILQSLGVRPSSLFPPLPAEAGFTTYGGAAFTQCLLAEASDRAFHDCWTVKYTPDPQQRRARPEELLATPERLHPLWHERGAPLLSEWNGHLPLPIAEGSPLHPSWISGHAATAAAEAVILMAGIADSPWPGVPLQASLDGTSLIPTSTTALTIHRELRKFAWNKSFGRVALGVHYRSDITAGLLLGQAAAVDLLRQVKAHAVEPWGTTAFIGFDGKVVTI
jgi:membrane-associated phospholipid phosphatase